VSLLLALNKNLFGVYHYLWSEEFVNVWRFQHTKHILDLMARAGFY